ncbi:PD-(D/E)XK nuclease family protein [uncultured Alistipes sp.]|uniref:PD-(D/E)XK nuclease family protein n=1 Tax=uncultured Alistipes sp. TaxID=538949 RepID=UPI0026162E6C|nr:PD-(D/E)XK nuclease family protein [uncultured Alistipes sp.]
MAQNQNPVSVNSLQSSPLFQLSLTSKELFHSNFLYWLGVTYRDLFKETFSNLGCRTAAWPEGWTVEREYKAAKSISLDLCVKGPGKRGKIYLILENKVKSIPNQQQLNRYVAIRNVAPTCDFILLSLATDFPDKDQIDVNSGGKWIVWNYGDLAAALDKALTSCGGNVRPFHKAILEDYIQMVRGLDGLFGHLTVDDNGRYCDNVSQVYANLRMDDVYEKVRTSSIVEKLRNRLKKEFPNQTIDIKSELKIEEIGESNEKPLTKVYVDSGYTNKQGVVDAKVKINDRYVLTVQIQGEQYRHAIEWLQSQGNASKNWTATQKEYFVCQKLNFFDVTKFPYPQKSTRSNGLYGKFKDDFLYRYRKIKDNETVDNVLNEVVNDICHIFETYGQH